MAANLDSRDGMSWAMNTLTHKKPSFLQAITCTITAASHKSTVLGKSMMGPLSVILAEFEGSLEKFRINSAKVCENL